jgi:hypothetical protein
VLNAVGFVPGCDAERVQIAGLLPGSLTDTVALETPPATVWPLTEQGPVATKFTGNPFGLLFDSAVAVTVTVGGGVEYVTELCNGPRTIVWRFFTIAGTEGALDRMVGSIGTDWRVVEIV